MNQWNGIGRTTKDIDLRYTQGGTAVARFTLAVDRGKNSNGERMTDFIPCEAFGKVAEILGKHVKKGNLIGVTGRIQTGSYSKMDGTKVYTVDVIAERIEFLEKLEKPEQPKEQPKEKTAFEDEDFAEDLPF